MPHKNSQNKPKPHSGGAVPVKLDAETKARLDELGELKDRSANWMMKQAIERYIIAEEQAEALKQEILTRWENEAALDDVVPHKQVSAWLETWDEIGAQTPPWK